MNIRNRYTIFLVYAERGENMNENEKEIAKKIAEKINMMSQAERNYFIGVGDGIIYAKGKEKAEATA